MRHNKSMEGRCSKTNSDVWNHPQIQSSYYEDRMNEEINSRYRDFAPKEKKGKVQLQLASHSGNIEKSLNRSKLVRKRTMVRGKNGKVFFRQQWVDPNKDMHNEEEVHASDIESHVDKHISKMSTDEKVEKLTKHGVEWKSHETDKIKNLRATKALKKFYMENPHHIQAEHLPKEEAKITRTPSNTDSHQDWLNKHSDNMDHLYSMMSYVGVAKSNPYADDSIAEKMKTVHHMRNMIAFKNYLKTNPHMLEFFDNQFSSDTKSAGSTPKKVGKDSSEVMSVMSRQKAYETAKKLDLDVKDPLLDKNPDDPKVAVQHMRNMSAIKKEIEKKPEVLETPKPKYKDPWHEEVDSIMSGTSKELKKKWVEDLKDHPKMKERKRNDVSAIDWMHAVTTLKKILREEPELMKKDSNMYNEKEQERLLGIKVGNKELQKVLRYMCGIVGVGDVKIISTNVGDREWEFGDMGSFARIEMNDDNEPVLSIVDTGKIGDEWNESSYPMSKVSDFLDKLRSEGVSRETRKADSDLSDKTIEEVFSFLRDNLEGHWNSDVEDRVKEHLSNRWVEMGRTNNLEDFSRGTEDDFRITVKTMSSVLAKLGVTVSDGLYRFDSKSDAWKRVAYHHMITPTKSKHGSEYVARWTDNVGKSHYDVFPLHESARSWSPEERHRASMDLVESALSVTNESAFDKDQLARSKKKALTGIHDSLQFIPFDLRTDLLADMKIKFTKTKGEGEVLGASYNSVYNTITFPGYLLEDDRLHKCNNHLGTPGDYYVKSIDKTVRSKPIAQVMAHEVGHALDKMFSRNNHTGCKWQEAGKCEKYAGGLFDLPVKSYTDAVNKSNKHKEVGFMDNHGQTFYYHKDNFLSYYEGRIYSRDHINLPDIYMPKPKEKKDKDGNPIERERRDAFFGKREMANEHWSEAVSRYGMGKMRYQEYKANGGADDIGTWAKKCRDKFMDSGYGDDTNAGMDNRLGEPLKTFRDAPGELDNVKDGYLYHRMHEEHPELMKGIAQIFDRGDFVDETRKSEEVESFEGKHILWL